MSKEQDKTKILVTGASGQLGQCIQKIEENYPSLKMHFTDSQALNITKKREIEHFFVDKSFDFVINCAAYTNVEQAEKESEKAFLVNAEGVKNLAEVCKEQNSTLIHVSTDYVFDGKKQSPYTEEDIPNAINEYGKSKLKGEQYIQNICRKYFIIRTSWLYSEFGNNFLKTILKKAEEGEELTITISETGTPTNANDLAKFIIEVILTNTYRYGIYHYSNLGEATWYDFASKILSVLGKLESVILKKTDNYSTFAPRPEYSILDMVKTKQTFFVSPIKWGSSLSKFLKKQLLSKLN
ncbi:dTDP-4-dehydrorhamnose reductase [Aquimarina sp. AD10]|uniref:dTDP-4-dehydrorhamnose reductase n=1 Tax=Aquimarina sp. AD10 TaxID=1714849 RepID=UPI000E50A10E|nr:dTDP-4-dehydrorhamnose reductase [Aquimarina sp. AD10]AXT61839.1 dTDP-4-dehydrorhamnose reductase [Aquimarina sp. AD10]RKN02637.1 dTDP-4-dehydrorhamnose reductase [Aquimarina sp. AD10]